MPIQGLTPETDTNKKCSKCHTPGVFSNARCWRCLVRRWADMTLVDNPNSKPIRKYYWWKPNEEEFCSYLWGRYLVALRGYASESALPDIEYIFRLRDRQVLRGLGLKYIHIRLLRIVTLVEKRAERERKKRGIKAYHSDG